MAAKRNIGSIASSLREPWKPATVAAVNGFELKVVRLHGSFPWHVHDAEDELFQCVEGSFRIEQIDGENVMLRAGDVFVVPAGMRHRPVADEPAVALLFERAETKQYGDEPSSPG
jgi:mannose-6-phosphate isomerase-like protein (cupin superfamily)